MFERLDDKSVIFGDTHGRQDKVQAVLRHYRDKVDNIYQTGDNVDGYNVASTIELLKNNDVEIVDGNHEIITKLVMLHNNDEVRHSYLPLWSRIHKQTLESYGIHPNITTPKSVLKLQHKMESLGHLAYLNNAKPFIENAGFVVMHACVTREPWSLQRRNLKDYKETYLQSEGIQSIPYQFGFEVKYPDPMNVALCGINKVLVSGHFHSASKSPSYRTRNRGNHILLATQPKDDFVAVYESWSRSVRILELY